MVKIFSIILLLNTLVFADNFEEKCLSCHKELPLSFDTFYRYYLLKFSSNKAIKKAMFSFLKKPIKENSVMDKAIIDWLGLMPKINVQDKELLQLIDTYIQHYDVRKKLY